MVRRATAVCIGGALIALGCAGRGQVDLLQARLREQQQQLTAMQDRVDTTQRELQLARTETDRLRDQVASSHAPELLPEQADLLTRVTAIKVNPLLTASLNQDEAAGEDAMVVHFAPVDADGELVKLPGAIDITAIDPAAEESQRTVAHWRLTPEETRERWTKGLLGSGYQLTLPWPEPPQNRELVIHVTLRALDGREFTATHVQKINQPLVAAHRTERTPRETTREIPNPETSESPAIQESTNWAEGTIPVLR